MATFTAIARDGNRSFNVGTAILGEVVAKVNGTVTPVDNVTGDQVTLKYPPATGATVTIDYSDDATGVPVVSTINPLTGGIVSLVVDSAAPSDADGRPDGTIYVQTV